MRLRLHTLMNSDDLPPQDIYLIKLSLNFYNLGLLETLLVSILSWLIVPIYILWVSMLSKNKMEGMIWFKSLNILVILPIIAFFVPVTYSYFFWILPTYWIFNALNNILQGWDYLLSLLIWFIFFILLLWFTVIRFIKKHFI